MDDEWREGGRGDLVHGLQCDTKYNVIYTCTRSQLLETSYRCFILCDKVQYLNSASSLKLIADGAVTV